MTAVIFTKNAAGPTFGPYNAGDEVDLAGSSITKLTDASGVPATKPWEPPIDPTGHAPLVVFKSKKHSDSY